MPDPRISPRFDVYRSAREPSRFLTVPEGVVLQHAISRDSGVQVLDFLLFSGHAKLDAIVGFRCDEASVCRDVERQGYALHRGMAAVEPAAARDQRPDTEAEALLRRAAVLRERTAAWRRQCEERGEGWDGYCHTLAAVIALEERAAGLEERAHQAEERGWAA